MAVPYSAAFFGGILMLYYFLRGANEDSRAPKPETRCPALEDASVQQILEILTPDCIRLARGCRKEVQSGAWR